MPVICQCRICKKTLIRRKYNSVGNVYCSIVCRDEGRKIDNAKWREEHPNAQCPVCGKHFYSDKGRKIKTCSRACDSAYRTFTHKGAKSHLWKGGRTAEAVLIRQSAEYRRWRLAVLERDGNACQRCGRTESDGAELHAHHIKGFSDYPDLRFDVSNGTALCHECHEVVHGRSLTKWTRKPKR